MELGFELRALTLARQALLPLELLYQPFFVIFFEIGAHKLFAGGWF
jgi:hypothetical protein